MPGRVNEGSVERVEGEELAERDDGSVLFTEVFDVEELLRAQVVSAVTLSSACSEHAPLLEAPRSRLPRSTLYGADVSPRLRCFALWHASARTHSPQAPPRAGSDPQNDATSALYKSRCVKR